MTNLDLDNIAADGQLTLREAAEAARQNVQVGDAVAGSAVGPDEIRFADQLFEAGARTLMVQDPLIIGGGMAQSSAAAESLSIVGPGMDLLTIDGSKSNTNVFDVEGVVNVSGLEVTNANEAAILVRDDRTIFEIRDSRLTQNKSHAIESSATNRVTIHNSLLSNNQDSAISFLDGFLKIFDSEITGNSTTGHGGGIFRPLKVVQVGEDFFAGAGDMIIRRSNISDNHADGFGGGMATIGFLDIQDVTMFGNTSGQSGGAMWLLNSITDTNIANSFIANNIAADEGGGIAVEYASDDLVRIRDTTIEANVANRGGGISNVGTQLEVAGTTISGNLSRTDGGGIATRLDEDISCPICEFTEPLDTNSSSARTYIVNSTISGNRAEGDGGGIFHIGETDVAPEAALRLTNVTLTLNRSDADANGTGSGGGLAIDDTNGDLQTGPTTTLVNTIVAGNVVGQTGVRVVDDGDADLEVVRVVDGEGVPGSWSSASGGFQGDYLVDAPGTGSDIARWTFDGLQPGKYRVLTTWQEQPPSQASPVLIAPRRITKDIGSEFYPVANLINGSGLSAAADINNYTTVTHANSADSNSWVTDAFFPDYYSGGGPTPVQTFDLGRLFELSEVVAWQYSFAGNQARQVTATFSTTGPAGPFGNPVSFEIPQEAGPAHTVPLGGTFQANAVRLTYDTNWKDIGPGGDRVGLGEVNFIGVSAPATDAPFAVKDATRLLETVRVNQAKQPLPHVVDGTTNFQQLGEFTVRSGKLVVELSDAADAPVIADAVRIERVDDGSPASDIEVLSAAPNSTINTATSVHNLIGDPLTSGGLVNDALGVGNANLVGDEFNQPWNINRVLFTNLSDNLGGSTAVHALKVDSPALNAGTPDPPLDAKGNPLTSDQRGYPFARTNDLMTPTGTVTFPVDIGAYEVQIRPTTRSGEIVVSTLSDVSDGDYSVGQLSLREAVELANLSSDHSAIRFSAALLDPLSADVPTITLTSLLEITGQTTISGLGAEFLTISGQTVAGLIRIAPGAEVVLSDLRFANFDSAERVLLNEGHTTIAHSVFEQNTTNETVIHNIGTLKIYDSEISNNATRGILNYPLLSVDDNARLVGIGEGIVDIGPDVVINNNTTNPVSGGGGAGIFTGFGVMTIVDSVISNNTARADQGGSTGGGILAVQSRLEIRRSTIAGNKSEIGAGGGIASIGGSLLVFDSTIEDNQANSNQENRSVKGGGVFSDASDGGIVEIDRSTFAGNVVYGSTTVSVESAFGGGMYLDATAAQRATIRSSTFSNNRADAANNGRGGGFFHDFSPGSPLVFESNTVAFNEAGVGGGAYLYAPFADVSNNIISDNTATMSGEKNVVFCCVAVSSNAVRDNLVESFTGGIVQSSFAPSNSNGNIVGEANLGPLEDNGGFTKTHSLNVDSAALESGDRDGLLDQRGFPITDNDFSTNDPRVGTTYSLTNKIADIGAYESSKIVVEEFQAQIRDASQFGEGTAFVAGQGFDFGRPLCEDVAPGVICTNVPKEPGFLGLEFDPAPFTVGPGVGEGLLGDEYGGELTADLDGRIGFEYGYYVNSGSVDTFYDGLFSYRVERNPNDANVVEISTAASITDGALFTVSPRVGAYLDLVFEFNAALSAKACVVWCADGEFDINIDESTNLLSINRQRQDANGNAQFLAPNGSLTTNSNGGLNPPAFDGKITFVGTDSGSLAEEAAKQLLEDAESIIEYVAEQRETQAKAEIEKARKKREDLNADTSAEDERIRKAKDNEKKASKKKDQSGFSPCLEGKTFEVCFSQAEGDLLGGQAELSVEAIPFTDIQRKVGSLTLTLPDIQLSDAEADAQGRLSATTDDFIPGSTQDAKRQLLALSVDAAAIAAQASGFPLLGQLEREFGPIGIEFTPLSYNITPRLAVSQDVAVEPFFDANHQATFTFSGFTQTIDVTVGSGANARSYTVTANGVVTDVDTDQQTASDGSISFMPGQKITVDAGDGQTVDIAPSIKVGNRFSNDIGLDIDVRGMLEVLRLKLSAFGEEIFDLGPLYEDAHSILDPVDLGSIFNATFNLPATETTLQSFTIGEPPDTEQDGLTPGSAAVLESGVSNSFDPEADGTVSYFAVPLVDINGVPRSDIRFATATTGNQASFVRPPYAGLTLELINNDTVITAFEADIAGVDLTDPNITAGWDGHEWRLSGFENLLGGQAIFGVAFNSGDALDITATAEGGAPLSDVGVGPQITAATQRAGELEINLQVIDNDFAFDIDDNGVISVTEDGTLVARYIESINGGPAFSIDGAVALDAKRTEFGEILAYLRGLEAAPDQLRYIDVEPGANEAEVQAYRDGLKDGRRLDVDDSATFDPDGNLIDHGIDPAVDKLLILRQMSGIGASVTSAPNLTDDFADGKGIEFPANARRTGPEDIRDFIAGRRGPRAIVAIDPQNPDAGDQTLSRSTRGEAGLFAVLDTAVLGSSPWNAIETSFDQAQGTYSLATFGQATDFDDVFIVDTPDILVRTGASGTPGRSFAPDPSIKQYLKNPLSPDIRTFESRIDTTSRMLGIDAAAPIFVRLPDAAAYELTLPAGYNFARLDIDSVVGGNAFLDHEGNAPDFDLYLPAPFDQWHVVSMDTPFDLPAGVETIQLYPRDLANPDLHSADNKGEIDLDLRIGFVIAGPATAPDLEVTVLSDRQSTIEIDEIYSAGRFHNGVHPANKVTPLQTLTNADLGAARTLVFDLVVTRNDSNPGRSMFAILINDRRLSSNLDVAWKVDTSSSTSDHFIFDGKGRVANVDSTQASTISHVTATIALSATGIQAGESAKIVIDFDDGNDGTVDSTLSHTFVIDTNELAIWLDNEFQSHTYSLDISYDRATESELRLTHNGAFLDLSIDDNPAQITSDEGLSFAATVFTQPPRTQDDDLDASNNDFEIVSGIWQTPQQSISPGPSVRWNLDESTGVIANDSAGTHDANYRQVQLGLTGAGKNTGSSVGFDGTSSFVKSSLTTNELGGTSYSLSLWVKSNVDNKIQTLLAATQPDNNDQHAVLIELETNGEFRFLNRLPSGITGGQDLRAGSYQKDRWYHIVAVRDGSTMRLYVDGAEIGTSAASGAINFATDINLGRLNLPGNQRPFDGEMDDVSIFNRALTQAEVWELFRSGTGGFERDYLVGNGTARWTFDDLEPGSYRVYTTWPAASLNVPDTFAKIEIKDGGGLIDDGLYNQAFGPPPHVVIDGTNFQQVGDYTISDDRLIVELSNFLSAPVAADAVRIERLGLVPLTATLTDSLFVDGRRLRLDVPASEEGSNTVTMNVTDADGNKATDTFRVTVTDTLPEPRIQAPIADVIVPAGTTQHVVDLSNVFSGTGSTLTASSDDPQVIATISGTNLTLNIFQDETATITVTATGAGSVPLGTDTFTLSIGDPTAIRPTIVSPIPDQFVLQRSGTFSSFVELLGRYTDRTEFSLASLTARDSNVFPADQLKPIQVLGQNGVRDTFIIDGTGGPIHQPLLFRGNSFVGIPRGEVGDIVQVEGSGVTIDAQALVTEQTLQDELASRDKLQNVAIIDLRGSGANNLTVDKATVTNNERGLGNNPRLLVVVNADDGVVRADGADWTLLPGQSTDPNLDAEYNFSYFVYQATTAAGTVELWVSDPAQTPAATPDPGPAFPAHTPSTLTRDVIDESELPAQLVILPPDAPTVSNGQFFEITLGYEVSDLSPGIPPGLLIEVHYDGDHLAVTPNVTLTTASGLGFLPSNEGILEDIEAVPDGDLRTNRVVVLAWSDVVGRWPADATLDTLLATLEFQVLRPGRTFLRVTGLSSSGYRLDTASFEINVPEEIIVTSLLDVATNDGLCTLREAIHSANTNTGSGLPNSVPGECVPGVAGDADVIAFAAGLSGTLTLTSGHMTITDSVQILGPGEEQLSINAQGNSRIFDVEAAAGDVTIEGLTLTGGQTPAGESGGAIRSATSGTLRILASTINGSAAGKDGGGIFSQGGLSLVDSTVAGNTAINGGGGIAQRETTAQAEILASTISGNSAAFGGGFMNLNATASIVNSTISGNTTTSLGGGIVNVSDQAGNEAHLLVLQSTITQNSTGAGGAIHSGTQRGATFAEIEIGNSLIVQQLDGENVTLFDQASSSGATITSLGHNLADGLSVGLNAAGDRTDITGSVLETVLKDNGGPTKTHGLPAGSPAIDAGDSSLLPISINADQRGRTRIFGASVDVGALEFGSVPGGSVVIPVGVTQLTNENGTLFLRHNGNVLFQNTRENVTELTIQGGDGDETLAVGELGMIGGQQLDLHFDGGSGIDTFRLLGESQTLDLTTLTDTALQNVDIIDITGSGGNTLTLTVAEVRNISAATGTLRVQHDLNDTVNYGVGWKVAPPQIVDGQFVHILTQQNGTIEVVNTTPFRNPLRSGDVNFDGRVSPLDALIIINQMNSTGPKKLVTPTSVAGLTDFFYVDANGDGFIVPLDVLIIVNFLNTVGSSAEGEFAIPGFAWNFHAIENYTSAVATSDEGCGLDFDLPAVLGNPQLPEMLGQYESRSQGGTPNPSEAKDDDLISAIDAFFSNF